MTYIRKYSIPDAKLLEHTEIVVTEFENDKADFEMFDTSLASDATATLTKYLTDIDESGTDKVLINEQAEITKLTIDALNRCNVCTKTIFYFVKKRFKNDAEIRNQFGMNDIAKVKNKQNEMIQFMKSHDSVVHEYAEELKSVGCKQEQIDAYTTSWKDLETRNVEQELKKISRSTMTAKRIESLNNLYDMLRLISDAAKIIYSDDEIKLRKYSLPTSKSSTDSPEDMVD
ncbi:MAG: hypothetical protein N4A72_08665 [Bacteroidales bacterium]|jgi:hypothetical protein|nr:hypothetical protein [Bacteroidales bacterium]